MLIGLLILLSSTHSSLAADNSFPPVTCYNHPIAKDYLANPDLLNIEEELQNDHLWLGKISAYAIRQKRRLTFEIMIIAEQLALKADYPAHALEQVKTSHRIPVANGGLGAFAVYMEINPRNLAQRDNLREFIEDELQQENSHLFVSGRVKRLVTFRGQRYPLLTYSQISFGPDYKIEVDPRPRLFRSDLPAMPDSSGQLSAICQQLQRCLNRWDQAVVDSCR